MNFGWRWDMAIRVVVAERYPVVRQGLAQLMAIGGILPVESESCSEAFSLAESVQPDVVLMSDELAGMAALRRLKRTVPAVRVVLYSLFSERSSQSTREMAEAGVCGYVGRDTDVRLLVEAVKHVASGGTFFPEEMIKKLFDELTRGSPARNRNAVTPREAEVLYLVKRGCSNKEIAAALGVAESTVRTHVRTLMQKVGMHKRIQLAVYAEQHAQYIGAAH